MGAIVVFKLWCELNRKNKKQIKIAIIYDGDIQNYKKLYWEYSNKSACLEII